MSVGVVIGEFIKSTVGTIKSSLGELCSDITEIVENSVV